jgi:pimeloyl-ACP methyl ester carboxylesterase
LLLHGLGATAGLNWAGAFHLLGEQFRVIAIDHRGHGRGIRTPRFRLEDCADDVAALMDLLGIETGIPVGYSMGGSIAALVWRRHPERTLGLVLMATSRNFAGRPADRLWFAAMGLATAIRLPAPPAAEVVRAMARRMPLFGAMIGPSHWVVDELCRHDPQSLLQAAAAVGRFSCHQWAGDINVPVAVVATTLDRIVPVPRQVRLARAIPTAVLHPVDNGHLAVGAMCGSATMEAMRDACAEVAYRADRRAHRSLGAARPAIPQLGQLPA